MPENGEIRVNEIFYSSLNKCSILWDSNWENKSYSPKGVQNLACFFFFVSKKLNGQANKNKTECRLEGQKKLHYDEIMV